MTKSIDEKVAKKMGWIQGTLNPAAWSRGEGSVFIALPAFSTDWNATKILIKFMRARGWGYEVFYVKSLEPFQQKFCWDLYGVLKKHEVDIISNNLPLAACEAFLLIDLEVEL